jgi:hypothetical protein
MLGHLSSFILSTTISFDIKEIFCPLSDFLYFGVECVRVVLLNVCLVWALGPLKPFFHPSTFLGG